MVWKGFGSAAAESASLRRIIAAIGNENTNVNVHCWIFIRGKDASRVFAVASTGLGKSCIGSCRWVTLRLSDWPKGVVRQRHGFQSTAYGKRLDSVEKGTESTSRERLGEPG